LKQGFLAAPDAVEERARRRVRGRVRRLELHDQLADAVTQIARFVACAHADGFEQLVLQAGLFDAGLHVGATRGTSRRRGCVLMYKTSADGDRPQVPFHLY